MFLQEGFLKMGLFGAGPVVRFRGKLKAGTGDRDIVPIVVEYLGANLTLWATIAPPRAAHTKQKPIYIHAVPVESLLPYLQGTATKGGRPCFAMPSGRLEWDSQWPLFLGTRP